MIIKVKGDADKNITANIRDDIVEYNVFGSANDYVNIVNADMSDVVVVNINAGNICNSYSRMNIDIMDK